MQLCYLKGMQNDICIFLLKGVGVKTWPYVRLYMYVSAIQKCFKRCFNLLNNKGSYSIEKIYGQQHLLSKPPLIIVGFILPPKQREETWSIGILVSRLIYNIICDLEEDGNCIWDQRSRAEERPQVMLKDIVFEGALLSSNTSRVCPFDFTSKASL